MIGLQKIKISSKIYAGFGLLLALILILSTMSLVTLHRVYGSFNQFRNTIDDNVIIAKLQSDLAYTGKDMFKWLNNRSDQEYNQVMADKVKIADDLEHAKANIKDPDRVDDVLEIEQANQVFFDGFSQVAEYYKQRDEFVLNQMNVIGPKLRKHITNIGQSSYDAGDFATASRAGFANQELLLARLYARRFLLSNDIKYKQRYDQHMEALLQAFSDLEVKEQTAQHQKWLR